MKIDMNLGDYITRLMACPDEKPEEQLRVRLDREFKLGDNWVLGVKGEHSDAERYVLDSGLFIPIPGNWLFGTRKGGTKEDPLGRKFHYNPGTVELLMRNISGDFDWGIGCDYAFSLHPYQRHKCEKNLSDTGTMKEAAIFLLKYIYDKGLYSVGNFGPNYETVIFNGNQSPLTCLNNPVN